MGMYFVPHYRMSLYIGIDPGLSGALSIIFGGGQVEIYDTPVLSDGTKRKYDIQSILSLLRTHCIDANPHCFIEEVHAMPGQGVTSMFSMGYGLGVWHTVLAACDIPFERITPQSWKKEFSLIGKEKGASMLRAKEIHPTAPITLKKHDGRADALLLAELCRRRCR